MKTMDGLYEAVAESYVTASDDEVLEEAGAGATRQAARVRQLLLNEVRAFRRRDLDEAMRAYREEIRRFRERRVFLPEEPSARRRLLEGCLARFPGAERTFLTLQHRGFKNLSDEDVESCLRQLEALGVLDGRED